ncbi:hypothetical protein JCM17961_43300 [Endothiovibrio diazotrophicus]
MPWRIAAAANCRSSSAEGGRGRFSAESAAGGVAVGEGGVDGDAGEGEGGVGPLVTCRQMGTAHAGGQ